MAKPQTAYVCQSCGAVSSKWQGKCDSCGAWNSLIEDAPLEAPGFSKGKPKAGKVIELASLSGGTKTLERIKTGIGEFDRPLGGGAVPGSAILVGGDPGIGKSTLVLQALANMAGDGKKTIYITGEESVDQIRMRAGRLGMGDASVIVASETNVGNILATLRAEKPDVIVIDSIQTMFSEAADSSPGSITQVRLSSQNLIHYAKTTGATVFLIGHVTKDGQIAGPKTMEHMVDTVLYFEGERTHQYRILRATKNRFGGVDEIGVFEMTGAGLLEVKNPSALFMSDRKEQTEGVAVFSSMEGTRALLAEIEALVVPTSAANPRRAVVGWDSGRLAMILAVLDSKLSLGFGASDVYLNIAGGLKVNEPAADVPVAAALISSLTKRPLPAGLVMLGEISLSGEIRPVSHLAQRLKEAEKLGFERALVPGGKKMPKTSLQIINAEIVADLLDIFDIKNRA